MTLVATAATPPPTRLCHDSAEKPRTPLIELRLSEAQPVARFGRALVVKSSTVVHGGRASSQRAAAVAVKEVDFPTSVRSITIDASSPAPCTSPTPQ